MKKQRTVDYYTQEEIKEVVAYAGKKEHIMVIPEIEMPDTHQRVCSVSGIVKGK